MSDDLVSFKAVIASGVEAERDLLRECTAKGAFPVDYAELSDPNNAAAICGLVAQDAVDFIFVGQHLSKNDRGAIYKAALAAHSKPLVIFVGAADLAAREVLQEDATADGILARPVGKAEAGAMIDNCARARLPKQVLVVDDSAIVRAVVRKVLQASRFRMEIAEAEDGNAAAELVSKQRFDIVLLDCNMPGVDGFATLDRLKSLRNDLSVVMTTSTRDARIEDRARASGADDFLFKPFYANDIDAILRRLFGLVRSKAD